MFNAQKNILYSFFLLAGFFLNADARPLNDLEAAELVIIEMGEEQGRLRAVIKDLHREISAANKRLRFLQDQNSSNGHTANAVANDLINKNNSLQGTINSQQDKIVRLSNKIASLEEKLYRAKSEKSSLGNQANQVVTDLLDKIAYLEREIKGLNTDKKHLIGDCAILQTYAGDTQLLIDHIIILEAKLAQAENDVDLYFSCLTKKEKECDHLQSKNYSLRNDRDNLQARIRTLSSEANSLAQTITSMKREIGNLKDTIEGLRQTIVTKNRHLYNGGIDTREFDILNEDNLALKKEMRDLQISHADEKASLARRAAEESSSSFATGIFIGSMVAGLLVSVIAAGLAH